MQDIQDWLDTDQDFLRGRELYALYAPRYLNDRGAAYQIKTYDNEFSRELLFKSLSRILELVKAARREKPTESHKDFSHQQEQDLPDDLQELARKVKLLYKKRDQLRYQSRQIPSGDKLHSAARHILLIDHEIRKAYSVLDYFTRTGNYPPGYGKPMTDEITIETLTFWLHAQRSFPSYISRNKNKPNRQKEVAYKQSVLTKINEYLSNAPIQE